MNRCDKSFFYTQGNDLDHTPARWYDMEFCARGCLWQIIYNPATKIGATLTLYWFSEMLEAIEHLHEVLRFAHCDIKPDNILITEENNVRLADFGKSQKLVNDMVEQRAALGSPFYVAPEANRGHEWGSKYDMWSLACVFYEAITKKHFARFENLDEYPVQQQLERVTQEMVDAKLGKGFAMFPEFLQLMKILSSILVVDPIFRPSAQEVRTKYQINHNLGLAFEVSAPACIVPHIPTEVENTQHYMKKAEALQQQVDSLFHQAKRDDEDKKKLIKECESLYVEVVKLKNTAEKEKASEAKKRAHGQLDDCITCLHQPDGISNKKKQYQASSSLAQDQQEENEEEEEEADEAIVLSTSDVVDQVSKRPTSEKKKNICSSDSGGEVLDSEDEVNDSEDEVIDSERVSSEYSGLVDGKHYLHGKRPSYKIKDLTLTENQKKFVEMDKYKVKEASSYEKARKEVLLRLLEKKSSVAWRLVFCSMNSLAMTAEITNFQNEIMAVKKGNLVPIEEHLLCAVLVIGETSENATILYKLAGGKRKQPSVSKALRGIIEEAGHAKEYPTSSASASTSASTSTSAPAQAAARAVVPAVLNRPAFVDPRVVASIIGARGTPTNAIAKQRAVNVPK